MKRLASLFLAAMLPLLPSVVTAQTPDQIATVKADVAACEAADAQLLYDLVDIIGSQADKGSHADKPCGCKKAIFGPSQDDVDGAQAAIAGLGGRAILGPHREVALAIRQWRANLQPNDPNALTNLQAALGRGKLTPCQKATYAVIALEMVNSFSPGTIPPQVLAMAIQIQQQVCNTPVPPTPTRAKSKAVKLAEPATTNIPLPPKKYATGLVILPVDVRNRLHVKDALSHREFHAKHGTVVVPPSLDLRGTIVPPIEDQGQQGTCHDFSGVDTVTCANIKVGNLTVTSGQLSEQFIVNLNPNNDGGCQGGDASTIFQWLKAGGNGIPLASLYPYTQDCSGTCQLTGTATGWTIDDWGYAGTVTGPADVLSVQEAMNTYGVISVCIGCPSAFMNYSGGIITYDLSSGIDHQVSLVGYKIDKTVKGGGYWILRNSWSPSWGENGYARVSFASKPTTEAMWCTAAKGQTVVVQPWGSPTPDTPTHRASIIAERAAKAHKLDPAKTERVLKYLESEYKLAP